MYPLRRGKVVPPANSKQSPAAHATSRAPPAYTAAVAALLARTPPPLPSAMAALLCQRLLVRCAPAPALGTWRLHCTPVLVA
ncbi:hypothetical protein EON68_03700 [archaeon]|nr:MAG: hypothetical protein EON68_03700 [archaeon]